MGTMSVHQGSVIVEDSNILKNTNSDSLECDLGDAGCVFQAASRSSFHDMDADTSKESLISSIKPEEKSQINGFRHITNDNYMVISPLKPKVKSDPTRIPRATHKKDNHKGTDSPASHPSSQPSPSQRLQSPNFGRRPSYIPRSPSISIPNARNGERRISTSSDAEEALTPVPNGDCFLFQNGYDTDAAEEERKESFVTQKMSISSRGRSYRRQSSAPSYSCERAQVNHLR